MLRRMNLRRRMLVVAAILATVAGAVLWSRRGLTLALSRDHPVLGRVLVPAARSSAAPIELSGAVTMLDEPGRQAETRALLNRAVAESRKAYVDFGFGTGDPMPEIGLQVEGSTELPPIATSLLQAQKNPIFILHTRQPAALARIAARRGWLGPLAADIFSAARSISVVADEDKEGGWLRFTLALEFEDGAGAERALAQLTSADGDYGKLGFVAQPGYERVVRQTRLVVIRLDARTDQAARALRAR